MATSPFGKPTSSLFQPKKITFTPTAPTSSTKTQTTTPAVSSSVKKAATPTYKAPVQPSTPAPKLSFTPTAPTTSYSPYSTPAVATNTKSSGGGSSRTRNIINSVVNTAKDVGGKIADLYKSPTDTGSNTAFAAGSGAFGRTTTYGGNAASETVSYSKPVASGAGRTNEGIATDTASLFTRQGIDRKDSLRAQLDAVSAAKAQNDAVLAEKRKAAEEAARAAAPAFAAASEATDQADAVAADPMASMPLVAQENVANIPATPPVTPPPFEYQEDPEDQDVIEARKLERQLKAIEEELAGASAQSTEEIEAEAKMRDLLASKELGLTAVAGQAIPMGFITGQQQAIERRAANMALPLESQIALLQAKRKQVQDAAKSRLAGVEGMLGRYDNRTSEKRKNKRSDYEYSRSRADQLADETRKMGMPSEIGEGQSVIRYNPATGKVETLYSKPKTYSPNESSGDGILSPTEAEKFGVPYGTRKSEVVGRTPGTTMQNSVSFGNPTLGGGGLLGNVLGRINFDSKEVKKGSRSI